MADNNNTPQSSSFEEQYKALEDQRKVLDIQQEKLINKAVSSDNPMDIIKAMNVVTIKSNEGVDYRKSTFVDPFTFDQSFGYKSAPNRLTYSTLFSMSKTSVVNAIVRTRKTQVAGFSDPQPNRYSNGFIIRKKGHFIEDQEKLSKEDRRRIDELTEFILNTGSNQSWDRDDFDTFLRKFVEDSLIFDQSCFEVVRDMSGGLYEFVPVDGSTIRIADSFSDKDYKGDERVAIGGHYPSYVQMIGNELQAEYYPWEMCFGVRNPTTRLYSNGYGRSELEDMVTLVTSMLWSDQYNSNFFRHGAAPKGILRVKGGSNNVRLQEFKQQWRAMVAGVDNCIGGDVTIRTKEAGTVSVESFLDGSDEKKATIWVGDSWQDGLVYKTSEPKKYCQTKLSNGDSITTSPDHKFKVIDDSGELSWKRQEDLNEGDYVLLNKNDVCGEFIPEFRGALIEPELMEVLGWMIGDGHMLCNTKQGNIHLNYHHEKEGKVMRRHEEILLSHLINVHVEVRERSEEEIVSTKERYGFTTVADAVTRLGVYDTEFVRFLMELGFHTSKQGKVIPAFITRMPSEYIGSFLRGFFSADGCNAKGRSPVLSVTDSMLRNQTRDLLNSMGIRCNKSEGKGSGRFGTEKGKSNALRVKDKDRFFEKVGFVQDKKQPVELVNKNESCKHNRIAHSFVIRHLLGIREHIKTGSVETCSLSIGERNQINSILSGKDGCSLNRLIRIANKAGYQLPSWVFDYNFEHVDELARTDILIDMYDVSINEERHQFMGNNILISNSWRTPVIDSESMEWIDLQKGHRDMEFTKWQEYLIKLSCALYIIDPSEIGFPSGSSGTGGKSLFESDQTQRIKYSQDKGLKPLLRFIQAKINKYIVSQIYPDLTFEFVGLDAETEKEHRDRVTQEVQNFKTVNEVRKEENLPPLPNGDVILSPTMAQYNQQAQQEEMMNNAGGPGGEGQGDQGQFEPPAGGDMADLADQGSETEKAYQFEGGQGNIFANEFMKMVDDLSKGRL